jgi:hypothetical protein
MTNNLTPEEQKLFEMLTLFNSDSIIGLGVNQIKNHTSEEDIRKSFKELRSQAYDNPTAMVVILGREMYDQLLKVAEPPVVCGY